MGKGQLAVDVPIRLQNLLNLFSEDRLPDEDGETWSLRQRPVDRAFGAMAPITSNIGSVTARFRATVIQADGISLEDNVDEDLFETYPAGSLRLTDGLHHEGYSNSSVEWDNDRWDGDESLSKIANELLEAKEEVEITDDDLDAIICALAAGGKNVLSEGELAEKMDEKGLEPSPDGDNLPKGYRLPDLDEITHTLERINVEKSQGDD